MTEQTYLLMHRHINGYGRVFGGQLMQWIDELAGIVSMRHAGGRITTASIDNLNFKACMASLVVITGFTINLTPSSSVMTIENPPMVLLGSRLAI